MPRAVVTPALGRKFPKGNIPITVAVKPFARAQPGSVAD
jgi:hypothetical protein